MAVHPSVNLLWVDGSTPDGEALFPFVAVNKLSLLSLPDDGGHLSWLDIFVFAPLAYTCSILAKPAQHS
jgi:hypothetical protein